MVGEALEDLLLAHHEQAQLGKLNAQVGEHLKQLEDALQFVQAATHGDDLLAGEPKARAKGVDGFLARKLGLQSDGVVHRSVNLDAIGRDGTAEFVGDDGEAVHIPCEHPADGGVAARAETKPLAGHTLGPMGGVFLLLPVVFLTTVEAIQFLVTVGHRIVRREDHRRTCLACLGQTGVGQIRVNQVRVNQVGLPLLVDVFDRCNDLAIVDGNPPAKARRIVGVDQAHFAALDLLGSNLLELLGGRDHEGLVSSGAQLCRLLVHQADRGSNARIVQVVEEENAHGGRQDTWTPVGIQPQSHGSKGPSSALDC